MSAITTHQIKAAKNSGTRLLLIDDDRSLCRLIREYLEPLGYKFTAAHNGPDGLERGLHETWSPVIQKSLRPWHRTIGF